MIIGFLSLLAGAEAHAMKRNAVRNKHIKNKAVTSKKLANKSVTNAKIKGPISLSKINTAGLECAAGSSIRKVNTDGSVECEADDTIGANDLADGSVSASKLADGAVANGKLASGAITSDKLADNSVTTAKIKDGEVKTSDLADGSVTAGKLVTGAVTASKLAGNIPQSKINFSGSISGNVQVTGNYRFASAKTYFHYINGNEFMNSDSSDDADWTRNGYGYGYPSTDSYTYVVAPVHLPQGANISQLLCYFLDDSAGLNWDTSSAFLYSRYLPSQTRNELARVTVNQAARDSNIIFTKYDNSVSGGGDPVDNALYGYWLAVTLDVDGTGTDFYYTRLYGCRIAYYLQEVSQ